MAECPVNGRQIVIRVPDGYCSAMRDADFIVSLGLPFLAHRLKRASESILEGTGPFLGGHSFDAPARSASTLLLLRSEGPLGVTEIARRLSLTHPLVIKLVRALLAAGYVSETADALDARRRLIGLTPLGKQQSDTLDALIATITKTFTQLFQETGADLYAAVERFEAAVEKRPIFARLEDMWAQEHNGAS